MNCSSLIENKNEIIKNSIIELDNIMNNWCENYTNNKSGGKMRNDRGCDIETFVRNTINNIGKKLNINLIAIQGFYDKKDLQLIIQDKLYVKKHQVDIHIYLDYKFIAIIECKAYLDSCYYVRACDDFKLFKKFDYSLQNYIFTLEKSIDDDTKQFLDHCNDNICNEVFCMLNGKRNSNKPVYDTKYKKLININNITRFIDFIYTICNIDCK